MGPGALWRNGALFRGQRNFWDAADDISAWEPLVLRGSAPQMLVNDVQNAFPLWHVERRRRFDPGRARVILDGPAESLATSRLSAALAAGAVGGYVAFTLPVHDDAMTL
jgi:hypothetical protein